MRWSHETSVSLTSVRDTISLHKSEFYTCEVYLHVRGVLHYTPYTNLFFPCHRQDGYAFMLSMSQFLPLQFSPSFTFASVVFFNLLNIWCFFSPKACYNASVLFGFQMKSSILSIYLNGSNAVVQKQNSTQLLARANF